jgi:hypothetical protein
MRPLTDRDFEIVNNWEANLPYRFDRTDRVAGERNFDVVMGVIHSRFAGNINETTLNAAVALVLPLLTFEKGFEHPIVKKQLEKKAQADAKAEADARALEAARQREAKTRAGINSDQTQITTELDRCEELNKPRLAEGSNEMAAIAFQDLKDDETMAEVASRIDRHRPFPHSKGAKQREVLTKLRFDLVKQRQSPEKILRAIESKIQLFEDASVR